MRSTLNWLILPGLLLAFSGCERDDSPTQRQGLEVVATYSILGDLVHQVGGDHVNLRTLVGPDGDAHSYEPTPQDSVALHDAQLVFENGLGFEGWLDDLFDASGSTAKRIVATRSIEARATDHEEESPGHEDHHGHEVGEHTDHVEPAQGHDGNGEPAQGHDGNGEHAHDHGDHEDHAHGHDDHADTDDHAGHDDHAHGHDGDGDHDDHAHGHDDHAGHDDDVESADDHAGHGKHAHGHDHGEFDPHVWHDVPNAIAMVTVVAEALAEADPSNAASYQANRDRYISELRELDAWVRTQVEMIPAEKRVLVTAHDTFGYFAEQYGFRTVTVLGSVSSEINDPSAAAVVDVVEQIKATGVTAVFAENIINPRLTEQIARQSGVTVVATLYTDALGSADAGGTSYIAMIRHNVQTMAEALR